MKRVIKLASPRYKACAHKTRCTELVLTLLFTTLAVAIYGYRPVRNVRPLKSVISVNIGWWVLPTKVLLAERLRVSAYMVNDTSWNTATVWYKLREPRCIMIRFLITVYNHSVVQYIDNCCDTVLVTQHCSYDLWNTSHSTPLAS